jgi:hypothetical protein
MIFMPIFEFEPGRDFCVRNSSERFFAGRVENRVLPAEGEVVAAVFVVEADEPWRLEIVVDLVTADVVVGK